MKNFFIILFVAMVSSMSAHAEVSLEAGVNVEAEAENSAAAKDMALKKAHREAFLKVASRLTTENNVKALDKLTDEQLLHFIREVEIVSEKSGAKVYRADLNITINGELLKQYMMENNMMEVVGSPETVLIIPVYSDTEFAEKVLWEDGNIWRKAWLDKGIIKSHNVDFQVLPDVVSNRKALTAQQALEMSKDTYDNLIYLNGVKDIFVVHAVRAGGHNLVLIINAFPTGEEKRIVISDESGEVFEPALAETVTYVTRAMQGKRIAESQNEGQISGVFYYFRLKEWLETEKKLQKIPHIKKVQTSALGGGKVQFRLDFKGSVESLQNELEKSGLSVKLDNNGMYVLK